MRLAVSPEDLLAVLSLVGPGEGVFIIVAPPGTGPSPPVGGRSCGAVEAGKAGGEGSPGTNQGRSRGRAGRESQLLLLSRAALPEDRRALLLQNMLGSEFTHSPHGPFQSDLLLSTSAVPTSGWSYGVCTRGW